MIEWNEPERRGMRIVCALWLLYLGAAFLIRVMPSLRPWTAETDWKQWLWIYHRFSTPGAFPPGQLLTDYAFVVQPPGYLAVTAALSKLAGPVGAATILYGVALAVALACAWWAVSARIHPVAALSAAVILAHDNSFFRHTVGGYPRSFGPALTLMFLAAWMHRKHWLVLVSFVLMGAVYPSVVVPCGLAYGAWSVALAGRAGFWPRNIGVAVAGGVAVVLAQMQSLRAPEWWGSVVTLAEAEQMPALGPGGRTAWVPLAPFWDRVQTYLLQPFGENGIFPLFGVSPWSVVSQYVVASLVVLALALLVWRARKDGAPWHKTLRDLPLEPTLLIAGSLCAYVLARLLAFKLYLPHRVVQHVLPYVTVVFVVLVLARALALLAPSAKRGVQLAALWLPFGFLVLAGDGLQARSQRSYEEDAPLYTWVEDNTPVDAVFAGNVKILDELPFFSKRQAYVNWKMAHPFRKGFYAEIERRILAMYDAFYATDVDQVLDFAAREHVTHFVFDTSLYAWVEQGDGQLFEPLRTQVVSMWRQRRPYGFALLGLPAELVKFRHGDYQVVDIAALRAWRATHPDEHPRRTVAEHERAATAGRGEEDN